MTSNGRPLCTALGWNGATTAVRLLTQVGSLALLSRWTSAAGFGAFAHGMLVTGLLGILLHSGLASYVVQRERLPRAAAETAAILSRLLGAVGAVSLWLAAPWLAETTAGDADVLRAMAPLVLFNGVAIIPVSIEYRRLAYRRLFWIESASYAAGYLGVAGSLAAAGCDGWSFVFGALVHEALRAALVQCWSGLRLVAAPSLRQTRRLGMFSATTSLTGATLHLQRNLDGCLIAVFLGAESLGLYTRAMQLVKAPISQVTRVTGSVLLSAFSRVQAEPRVLASRLCRAVELTSLLVFAPVATLAAIGEPVVVVALGESWIEAAEPFRVLCFSGFLLLAADLTDRAILAAGATRRRFVTHAGLTVASAVLIAIGTRWGLTGAAIGALGAAGMQQVVLAWLAMRLLESPVRGYFLAQTRGAVVAIVCGFLALAATALLPDGVGPSAQVATGLAVSAAGAFLVLPMPARVKESDVWLSHRVRMLFQASSIVRSIRRAQSKVRHQTATVRMARHKTSRSKGPVRVLQVYDCMDAGGAETRMVEVLGRVDPREFQIDFCTTRGRPGSLDAVIAERGGRVIPTPLGPHFPYRFARLLRRGRYDAVHTHAFHTSGVFLKIAHWAGTPVRINHYQTTADGRADGLRRRFTRAVGKRWVDRHATHVLGVCEAALSVGWSVDWREDPRCRVVYSGIDTGGWPQEPDRTGVRQEFGVPDSSRLLIHVGNFTPPKNHPRLIRIAANLMRQSPEWRLLLVGYASGEAAEEVRQLADRVGISHRVVMAGRRSDVGRLLMAADAMVFPSSREGLPGAILEASAVGLPVIANDLPGVAEVQRYLPNLNILSLDESDDRWVDCLLRRERTLDGKAALRAFATTPFSLDEATSALGSVWRGELAASAAGPLREAA